MDALTIFLLAFGGYMLIMGSVFTLVYRGMSKGADYKTTGEIVDVTPDAVSFNTAQGHGDAGQRPKVRTYVHAGSGRIVHLLYTYSVYGNHYMRADYAEYTENIARKKIGKTVDVYYSAEDPSIATIRTGKGFRIAGNILLWVAAALLIGALATWLL